jgi:hypothetical protein
MWSDEYSTINKLAERKANIITRILCNDSAVVPIQNGSESLPNFQADPTKFLEDHMEKGKNLKDTIKLEEIEFTIFEILLYAITYPFCSNLNENKITSQIVPLILKQNHFFFGYFF